MTTGYLKLAELAQAVEWTHPVSVTLEPNHEKYVRSATEAMSALSAAWPVQNGAHQIKAMRLCMLALQRQASQEVAREAFISAALEAGILSLGPHVNEPAASRAAFNLPDPQNHV